MAKKYVIALDQGTTSSRAIIYDKNAHPIGNSSKEFTQFYPQPGWVEHDAEEIFKTQLSVMQNVIIENGVKDIGNYAFYECYEIRSINIPDSVKNLGKSAFESCTA